MPFGDHHDVGVYPLPIRGRTSCRSGPRRIATSSKISNIRLLRTSARILLSIQTYGNGTGTRLALKAR